MARIKLKMGEIEVEVDSRDFYVDNNTLGEVIQNVAQHLPEHHAKLVQGYHTQSVPVLQQPHAEYGLDSLEDAETHEPEFVEPRRISADEIRAKLRILETSKFFNSPRTVTETVQQLREYGWAASSLDVSKALAKMASHGKIMRDSHNSRVRYSVEEIASI